jgi:hypothetical protein
MDKEQIFSLEQKVILDVRVFCMMVWVYVFFSNITSWQKETSYIALIDGFEMLLLEIQKKRWQGRHMEA